MIILYDALGWGAHLTKGQIAVLACIGIATVTGAVALAAILATEKAYHACAGYITRRRRETRTWAQLRNLEDGTCDGLTAVQVAALIENNWVLGDSEHR